MKESCDEVLLKTEEYLFLPAHCLRLPGLHAFGYAKFGEANMPLEEHYHPGCMEFIIMVGGSQTYEVNGKKYTLFPGDVFTNYAGELHGTGDEPQEVSEFYFMEIDVRAAAGFLGLMNPWDLQMRDMLAGWHRRLVRIPKEQTELVKEAFSCFAALLEAPEYVQTRLRGQSLVLAFFNLLLTKTGQERQIPLDIRQAMDYIDLHLDEPMEPWQIADAIGMPTALLRRNFKQSVGLPIRDYVTRRKIHQSRLLLQDNSMSMTDISYSLGFSDSSYFSSVFRQYMGCTPREYRRRGLRKQLVERD